MTLPTSIHDTTVKKSSFLGSVTYGSFKIAQSAALAVAGVTMMAAGAGGAYLTSQKIHDFYFAEDGQQSGYSDVPGFDKGCDYVLSFSHEKLGFPERSNSSNPFDFCESMGKYSFNDQTSKANSFGALVASLGLSSLSYIASMYFFLGGLSLVGKSFETFNSAIFGNQ